MKVYDGTAAETAADASPEPDRLKVGIAEYKVTTEGAILTTSGLGSCIGLALWDPEATIGGLAHVMMPSDEDVENGSAAKFADAGTKLLVEEVVAAGGDRDRLEAKLAGGSDMLDFSDDGPSIGERNATVVRETLSALGVPVVAADVGGDHGRSLRFETGGGDLVVKRASEPATRL